MPIGNGSGTRGLKADINVTPLIDVLLAMLIIFMVIVPVTSNGLEAQLPQQPRSPNQNSETAIVVQIIAGRDGQPSYKINQDDVAISDLGERLKGIFSVRPQKVMFVKGDANLDFSAVAQVLDIGKGAGADHIGLIRSKKNAL